MESKTEIWSKTFYEVLSLKWSLRNEGNVLSYYCNGYVSSKVPLKKFHIPPLWCIYIWKLKNSTCQALIENVSIIRNIKKT